MCYIVGNGDDSQISTVYFHWDNISWIGLENKKNRGVLISRIAEPTLFCIMLTCNCMHVVDCCHTSNHRVSAYYCVDRGFQLLVACD